MVMVKAITETTPPGGATTAPATPLTSAGGHLRAERAAIDPQLDVGIEHFQEGIEVATARSGQERIDDPSLSRESQSGSGELRNRRRGRLASCWAAASERSSVVAMSANGTPNTSCSTNASRSAGVNASSTRE
jgi:hypothetical protein